jgi:hypothetical protein
LQFDGTGPGEGGTQFGSVSGGACDGDACYNSEQLAETDLNIEIAFANVTKVSHRSSDSVSAFHQNMVPAAIMERLLAVKEGQVRIVLWGSHMATLYPMYQSMSNSPEMFVEEPEGVSAFFKKFYGHVAIVFGHNEDARAKLVGFGPRADKWDGNKAGETVLGGIFDDIGVFTLRDGTNCIPDAVSRVFDVGNQELASKEGNVDLSPDEGPATDGRFKPAITSYSFPTSPEWGGNDVENCASAVARMPAVGAISEDAHGGIEFGDALEMLEALEGGQMSVIEKAAVRCGFEPLIPRIPDSAGVCSCSRVVCDKTGCRCPAGDR